MVETSLPRVTAWVTRGTVAIRRRAKVTHDHAKVTNCHFSMSLSHGAFFLIFCEPRYIPCESDRESDHWSLSLVTLARKPILVPKTPIQLPFSSHFSLTSLSRFLSTFWAIWSSRVLILKWFCESITTKATIVGRVVFISLTKLPPSILGEFPWILGFDSNLSNEACVSFVVSLCAIWNVYKLI